MKGIELLASLLGMLMMIGVTAFLAGIIISVLSAATQPPSNSITYEMQLSPIYSPIKYETMLLSYLESTESSGFPIKKVLTYAAYQKNTTHIYIEGMWVTTLPDSSFTIFNEWIEGNGYLLALNVGGYEYIIVDNTRAFTILSSDVLKLKRISIPLYIDSETFKKIKTTHELPLNVTLDLYVQ